MTLMMGDLENQEMGVEKEQKDRQRPKVILSIVDST